MPENYLPFDDYRQICCVAALESERVTTRRRRNSPAGHLHKLGIALNYKDDPRLRDTHVLNPRWVTAGIYRILNARELAEQEGCLTAVDDLPDILPAAGLPAHDAHVRP